VKSPHTEPDKRRLPAIALQAAGMTTLHGLVPDLLIFKGFLFCLKLPSDMAAVSFAVVKKDSSTWARAGVLRASHGVVKTPAFVPVATKASVKALTNEQALECGTQLLMCNTYHLMLKPGAELIQRTGGLHKFMSWGRPLMTDSGGFQAFSLGMGITHNIGKIAIFPGSKKHEAPEAGETYARISDDGIHFKSHYDNSRHLLTPERSILIQEQLGADIIFALDECTSPLAGYEYTAKSLERTHKWALRSKSAHRTEQALFGIVQGGRYKSLRQESAKTISRMGFDGFGIGGSLGRSKREMHSILEWVVPLLPAAKPRHLLGIGTVEDFFESVERGIDLFDCVTPTRMARSGYVFISPEAGGRRKNKFRFKVTNSGHSKDLSPIDKSCRCYVCRTHSRAYISHLFKANELLAYTLATMHNLFFFNSLISEIRKAILSGTFLKLKRRWLGT